MHYSLMEEGAFMFDRKETFLNSMYKCAEARNIARISEALKSRVSLTDE